MGAWGSGVFSDDLACDVRQDYRDLIGDGVSDEDAEEQILSSYAGDLDDSDEGPTVWIALAVTQSKIGRLSARVRERALAAIDNGEGLDRWREDPKLLAKRVAVLDEVREQLTGAQPARQRLRARKRVEPSVGDVMQIDLIDGRFAYGRVLRDAGLSVYSTITTAPAMPPIGSRGYLFTVSVLEEVSRAWNVVGVDPSVSEDDDWPPPMRIGVEPEDGWFRIYHRGVIKRTRNQEWASRLEVSMLWDLEGVVRRIRAEAGE